MLTLDERHVAQAYFTTWMTVKVKANGEVFNPKTKKPVGWVSKVEQVVEKGKILKDGGEKKTFSGWVIHFQPLVGVEEIKVSIRVHGKTMKGKI